MLSDLDITIVGAGIGGLAAARALALRGADVTVLEQAEEIREVGAGLQISPNGFAVLEALGLGEALAAASVDVGGVSLRDYRGGEVIRLDLGRKGQSFHVVHRAALIDILANGAREAGVDIRLNQKVAEVSVGEPSQLTLEDGTGVETGLLIGADGLHSRVRREICPTSKPFFTGQVAYRTIVPHSTGQGQEVRLYMGPHRHVVLYPINGGRDLNVVAIQQRDDWVEESWQQEADAQEVQAAFADFCPEVHMALAQAETVHLWGLFRHQVALSWYSGAAAILGDAAHPTLPFLAQGANLALEDAWVLADALDRADRVSGGLAAYETRRRARVCRAIEAANGNAWKYHLASPPLRFAAHSLLRIAGRVAPGKVLGQFDWLYHHDVTREG